MRLQLVLSIRLIWSHCCQTGTFICEHVIFHLFLLQRIHLCRFRLFFFEDVNQRSIFTLLLPLRIHHSITLIIWKHFTMGNSNNPKSSTVPSTVVLRGTAELICGLCIECTVCSFRTSMADIHSSSLVGHVVVAGTIDLPVKRGLVVLILCQVPSFLITTFGPLNFRQVPTLIWENR